MISISTKSSILTGDPLATDVNIFANGRDMVTGKEKVIVTCANKVQAAILAKTIKEAIEKHSVEVAAIEE